MLALTLASTGQTSEATVKALRAARSGLVENPVGQPVTGGLLRLAQLHEQDDPAMSLALRVEMLPASHGDFLLVLVPWSFTMEVDSGPGQSTLKRLRAQLAELTQRDGRRHVDLFVMTRIDADHIANAASAH